ncbi:WbqC family protein [Alphaproteobacteria bacterium]|nr:WbqC family protein [Alphaproteobacteria bacterium]
MKTVCIHQPDFAPYLGFFDRLLGVDELIFLDDVQFNRRGWQHRDQIKSKHGGVWLTLPIKKGLRSQKISETYLMENEYWVGKHLSLIEHSYSKAKYFEFVFGEIEKIYTKKYNRLIDLNLNFLEFAFDILDISTKIKFSSGFLIDSSKSERIRDLVLAIGGSRYVTGMGSKNYLDENLLSSSGIKVKWQQFHPFTYNQLHGDFVPLLSCLDLFFNHGPQSANIIRAKHV